MNDTMESLMAELGANFRGLWVSNEVKPTGIEKGWAVTFVFDGEYCEIPYQSTAIDALRSAVEILNRLKREGWPTTATPNNDE